MKIQQILPLLTAVAASTSFGAITITTPASPPSVSASGSSDRVYASWDIDGVGDHEARMDAYTAEDMMMMTSNGDAGIYNFNHSHPIRPVLSGQP